eukprot:SAG25_NODE_241_length_11184_cov_4.090934_18_plen_121_part_00
MASIDKPVVKVIHVQPTASIEQVYTAPIIVLTACVQLMCSNVSHQFPVPGFSLYNGVSLLGCHCALRSRAGGQCLIKHWLPPHTACLSCLSRFYTFCCHSRRNKIEKLLKEQVAMKGLAG